MNGRKDVFGYLRTRISPTDTTIWFHCASLGEFEQGRPVIEKIRSQYANLKILVTFFSPSGYEVRKDYTFADVVCYLPLDTRSNAKRFIEIVNPKIAVFVKYEFWPNILNELQQKGIKTILISGIFRKDQPFFRSYGRWMRKSLRTFDHFFVQNHASQKLLKDIDFKNVTISGDTRFDRVYDILEQDNSIKKIGDFVKDSHILVAGSTWPKDNKLLIDYINDHATNDEKFIIAPHNIHMDEIEGLKTAITKGVLLFSNIDETMINQAQVLIIDSIGILTKVYSYAHIAYVGGGFGAGIHNILEPATYGVPMLIGPNYQKFNEAKDLVAKKACLVINNKEDFASTLKELYHNKILLNKKSQLAATYVKNNIGATEMILNYLKKQL